MLIVQGERVDTEITERSETSVKNRKIPFSLPSTSSGLHQPTDDQKQQLSAMFPEHPSLTISTALELTQGDMQMGAKMIHHHHSPLFCKS